MTQYQPSILPKPTPLQDLESDLALITDSPDLTNAHIGISIIDIKTKKEIYSYNHLKNFIPASVNKLLVTGAALELLGPDYAYNTDLYLSGDISLDGRFIGDVIVRGSGDPTISKSFYDDPSVILDDWIQQLKLLGIESISGNLIGDDSYFDSDYYAVGWDYMDLKEPFAAQVNAISIYENKVDINILPQDSIGSLPLYTLYPDSDYLEVENYLNTVGPSEKSYVTLFTEPQNNIVALYGNVYTYDRTDPIEKEISISNPTMFFLDLMRDRMEEYDMDITGELIDSDDLGQEIDYSNATAINGWKSPPIKDIIKEINRSSNNLVAEMLLKTIAREKSGVGSFENGTEVISNYLVNKGINPSMILIKDGSGLSRNNLISPQAIARYLVSMYASKHRFAFLESLARPGDPGTLMKRLVGTEAQNRVFAKTGSMSNVSTIAGYTKANNGKDYAFAIMMNNFTVPINVMRNIQDLIIMRLTSLNSEPKVDQQKK